MVWYWIWQARATITITTTIIMMIIIVIVVADYCSHYYDHRNGGSGINNDHGHTSRN